LKGLFVVGTDTGVGKTQIASAIARTLARRGRRVGVLKPVATGATRQPDGSWLIEDAEALREGCGLKVPIEMVCPIVYEEPLAPPVAARRAGNALTFDRLMETTSQAIHEWKNSYQVDLMIVEGVGGFLCPIAEMSTVADMAIRLDFPLVIVGRRGLGTLNHTLLTVEAARLRGLRIAGVVLNVTEAGGGSGVAEQTNPDELVRWLGTIPLLANVSYIEPEGIASLLMDNVDWYAHAQEPRQPLHRS
jgi:dethiobiotin synthetase